MVVILVFGALLLLGGDGGENSTPKELDLQNVTFCSEEPSGYREYQEQSNSEYEMENEGRKTFWMYADLNDVTFNEVEQGKEVDIEAYLTVKSPEGNVIFDNERIVNDSQIYSDEIDLSTYYLIPQFTLQNIGQLETTYGEYTVTLRVVDQLAGDMDTVTTTFSIREP